MEEKDMVYICSPLSDESKDKMKRNMLSAGIYARTVAAHWNCRAIAPHSFMPRYLDDNIPEERALAIEFGLSVLRICKALVICGDRISSGMRGEINTAREHGIPVYRLMEDKIPELVPVEEGWTYEV